jgi:hypothetical protein
MKIEECVTTRHTPKRDYVMMYNGELVLEINIKKNHITTLHGIEHFNEYDNALIGKVKVYKAVR